MTDLPPYLRPFVLPVGDSPQVRVERLGELDLYRPSGGARRGAILFVHGDSGPFGLEVPPRDWPLYQGYGKAAAARGVVGAVPAHSLSHGFARLRTASDDVEAAVGVLRADPQVDPDRIALWFFSGAGLLAGEWLDSRPEWLRCVLLSYPLLATPPGADELVTAAEVIGTSKDLPVLLTKVGREPEELAGPVAELVSAGGAALDIIDVPKGQHGFDMLDHTDESRAAVTKALDWAIAHLGQDPDGPAASSSTTTTTLAAPATTTTLAAPSSTAASATPPAAPSTATAPASPGTPSTATPTAQPVEPSSTATSPLTAWTFDTAATLVVERERAAYAAHDLEGFLATYSPTAQLQFADGTMLRGRRSLREHFRPRFEAGRCKTELLQRMTVGDWVVDQIVQHDSDQGPTRAIALYRVTDGLITEVRFLG